MTFPTSALLDTDHIGVEMKNKINAHFTDASQHGSGSSLAVVTNVAALKALTGVADGEHRLLSGYYAPADGGGGIVRRNRGSSVTVDDGMVFSSADGGRWERVWDRGALPAIWYGLRVGDLTNDAAPKIKKAHDYIVASGLPGVVLLPAGRLLWNTAITWDMSYVSLHGNSTTFEVPSTFTGTALKITGTRNPPYHQGHTYMAYIEFDGPAVGVGTCIRLESATSDGPSQLGFYGLNIRNWSHGIEWYTGAYCNNFISCSIHDCTVCVFFVNGGTNYGERMTFSGCDLYNSQTAIRADGNAAFFHFVQCSFDYCWQIVNSGSPIQFTSCHFEQSQATKNLAPIITSGTEAHFAFDSCMFVMTNRGGAPTYPVYINATSLGSASSGIVAFSKCKYWGIRTTSGNFAAGSRVFSQYPSYHDVGTTRFPGA